jgi:hypothetical protein
VHPEGMTRIILVPAPTSDGRHIILTAVPVTPADRLRKLVRSLGRRARRR